MPYRNKTLLSILVIIICCSFRVFLIQASNDGGFTADLIHRDSPHSPAFDPSKTFHNRLQRAIKRSFKRKSIIALIADAVDSTSLKKSRESLQSQIQSAGGEYLMKIHIGTPPVEQYGIADTGSDLTWFQCKPCTRCYRQRSPLFNPKNSATYKSISCKSEICAAAGDHSCGAKNRCLYEVLYGDNSYSTGYLSQDTVTFKSNDISFPATVFGCGKAAAGTFAGIGSGIIGLGGGNVSIIKQLNPSITGRFSYCLTFLTSNATSKINFGGPSATGANVVKTPIIIKNPTTFYHLTLVAISVGNERIQYKSETTGAQSGNIIIDSGTTLTFLDEKFVSKLEQAVGKLIKGERRKDSKGMFGLCYKKPSAGKLNVPQLTVHFAGANMVVPSSGVFVEVEKGVVCLTFQRSSDIAIFGNLHQMNYEVGFDLVKKEVSFVSKDCSK